MTGTYDWFAHLNPFERARISHEEREADRKQSILDELMKRRGSPKTKERLRLEIDGHRFMKQQYVNRGIQRARLEMVPKRKIVSRRRRAA